MRRSATTVLSAIRITGPMVKSKYGLTREVLHDLVSFHFGHRQPAQLRACLKIATGLSE